ncbi:hypothetical protein B9Z19DRAFT_1087428 [Tuber borchii]|uniref:Uncharacterized protein n=1 Tax=Tuber borchii TaxID=42251 RepID=A0A2T6ZN44_TUBBO|nr:hypothetical protein B9Z19DRAFT_1087428 [Tuber borchii]
MYRECWNKFLFFSFLFHWGPGIGIWLLLLAIFLYLFILYYIIYMVLGFTSLCFTWLRFWVVFLGLV